ncbi:MAG: chemotaxis-specific protein-glutamate methyltransferase CheB [Lachnospiraceae bacterium]|nr:chemotaxis-specific protein-glutamate methyltransferase CheB [Lachnospiraceae bacterium]
MAKILIVDHSALMRRWMCDILNADNDFHELDTSPDGEDAYNKILSKKYDLVIMDLAIPGMDGVELLARLKAEKVRVKVIGMSRTIIEDEMLAISAMQNGAYTCIAMPTKISKSDVFFEKNLREKVRLALGSHSKGTPSDKVAESVRKTQEILMGITRKENSGSNSRTVSSQQVPKQSAPKQSTPTYSRGNKGKLIALACSTGGPQALHNLIPMIPGRMNVPLVLVQHMPEGFTAALAERLDRSSQVSVKEAEDGEVLKPGYVYIAPGGRHLELSENRSGEVIVNILNTPPVNSLRPCADVMYDSIQKLHYDEIICVVLTGMGADGSRGIRDLKQFKKTYVISESQETCVVYGMPKAVEQSGLSDEVEPINKIADAIMRRLEE